MSDPKFTKGPWTVEKSYNGLLWVESPTSGSVGICDMYHKVSGGGFMSKDNAEANAHLIAAAPDMYEELKNAVNMCKSIMNGYGNPEIDHKNFRVQVAKWADDFLPDAEKALAKAEGKDNE